jgi:hypothetical protein
MIDALDIEGNRPVRRKPAARTKVRSPRPPKPVSRKESIEAHSQPSPEGLSRGGPGSQSFVSTYPFASFPEPSAGGRVVLAGLHEQLRPRTYLEIGVRRGDSLMLSRARSIAVDPAFTITTPINCDVQLVRRTSDDFFASPDAFERFAGVPVDLAFIDGMHLAEFALRDFMNTEKHMSRAGVVVLDDMMPRHALEACRVSRTTAWAGDVYKIHRILATYRPDLTIIPVNSYPTGSYLVVGLDPESTVLDDQYAEIEPLLTTPDPQTVPQEWLERRAAVDAQELLGLDVWGRLSDLREPEPSRADLATVWAELEALRPAGRPADASCRR